MRIQIEQNVPETEYDKVMYLSSICGYEPYTGEDGCCDDFFVFAYEDDTLVGFLSCFVSAVNEISGVVHPSYRRKGIFTAMHNYLKEQIHLSRYVFSGKDDYSGFKECAAKLNAPLSYHEYLMRFNGSYSPVITDLDYEKEDYEFVFYDNDAEIGSCFMYEEANQITIYNVKVVEQERGKGYGHAIINAILHELIKEGKTILLQVSELNRTACHIYEKCGFEIADAVLYCHGEDIL